MKINFGRFYKSDERDKKFSIKKHSLKSLKSSIASYINWQDTKWFGDQGETSQCVGYAWAHYLTNSPVKQFLPPDGIYHLAQRFDQWAGEGYEGTSVRAGAKVLKHLGYLSAYKWGSSIEQALLALQTSPIVLGINWYEGMMQTDSYGMITPSGEMLGGHAILVNGYNLELERFRLKNSWGQQWGISGRCYLSFADAKRLFTENGEVCLPVESMPTIPK